MLWQNRHIMMTLISDCGLYFNIIIKLMTTQILILNSYQLFFNFKLFIINPVGLKWNEVFFWVNGMRYFKCKNSMYFFIISGTGS